MEAAGVADEKVNFIATLATKRVGLRQLLSVKA